MPFCIIATTQAQLTCATSHQFSQATLDWHAYKHSFSRIIHYAFIKAKKRRKHSLTELHSSTKCFMTRLNCQWRWLHSE